MKKFFSCLLIASVIFSTLSTAAFAAKEPWEFKEIEYGDIDDTVSDCMSFPDVVSQLQSTIAPLSSYAKTLNDKLEQIEDKTSADYITTYNQLALVNSSILQVSGTMATLKQSMGEKNTSEESTKITVKTLFITYNSLRDQLGELSRAQTVYSATLDNLQLLHDSGFISDIQLEKAKGQSDSMQTNVQAMNSQLNAIKRSFNTMLGRDYNETLGIHSLPFSYLDKVGSCKFSSDLDDALAEYSGNTSGEIYENTDYDEEKGSFAASFRNLYDTMNDKKRLLDIEQNSLAVEQKSFDGSKRQFEAGLISKLDLISAQDKLDTQSAKVKAAQTALFKAYEQYQWAVTYGIISKNG